MDTTLPSNTRALLARSRFPQELTAFASWLATEHYTSGSSHRHLTQLEQALPRIPQPSCTNECLHQAFAVVVRDAVRGSGKGGLHDVISPTDAPRLAPTSRA